MQARWAPATTSPRKKLLEAIEYKDAMHERSKSASRITGKDSPGFPLGSIASQFVRSVRRFVERQSSPFWPLVRWSSVLRPASRQQAVRYPSLPARLSCRCRVVPAALGRRFRDHRHVLHRARVSVVGVMVHRDVVRCPGRGRKRCRRRHPSVPSGSSMHLRRRRYRPAHCAGTVVGHVRSSIRAVDDDRERLALHRRRVRVVALRWHPHAVLPAARLRLRSQSS